MVLVGVLFLNLVIFWMEPLTHLILLDDDVEIARQIVEQSLRQRTVYEGDDAQEAHAMNGSNSSDEFIEFYLTSPHFRIITLRVSESLPAAM